ncbi:hypothetical protein ACHAW5_009740 [Stephanodiscus triporus]|uniref:Uncharacterized protein n=1 Tax=Stephanodiscus triporus TaxID=2934178 RepID=A0ABD3QTZ4_9STRA
MCRPNGPSTKSQPASSGDKIMSSSSKKKKSVQPAFEGASFDKEGNCLKHNSVQLAEPLKQDGKLLYKEVKMNCHKCAAELHKSRRVTSLGGKGQVKRGRTVHGISNPLRNPIKSGRHMDKEFSTPFDENGKCHHHPNVQMASKKLGGGWKILHEGCPRCIEAKYEEDVASVGGNSRGTTRSRSKSRSRGAQRDRDEDAESVSSRSTKQSVQTRTEAVTSSGKFDKNGCCTRHPTVQVAKKKLLGGWKEFRVCPKCIDPDYDDMADNRSVKSSGSARSKKSTRSARSVKSNSSRKGGRKTDRFGALPFDEEGYCHAHPSVRLAKKKALGGWKVLHDICPDCAHDASSNHGGSVRSKSSKRSGSKGTGRVFDDSGSETSSHRSGKSSGSRKKKIRVKDMRYRDENDKEGRYSGDVNEDHQPHGQGKMKYKDGSSFEGVWVDGSQAHGKSSTKGRSSKSSTSGTGGGGGGKDAKSGAGKSSDWAVRKDGGKSGGAAEGGGGKSTTTVRKMKWMDYYGDPGLYTGEVDSSNMPNGRGTMKYDHGLIQDGVWARGQFVEGSDTNLNYAKTAEADDATKKTAPKKSARSKEGGGGGGGEKSSKKPSSSSRDASGKKMDP